jgi:hypothetical protein
VDTGNVGDAVGATYEETRSFVPWEEPYVVCQRITLIAANNTVSKAWKTVADEFNMIHNSHITVDKMQDKVAKCKSIYQAENVALAKTGNEDAGKVCDENYDLYCEYFQDREGLGGVNFGDSDAIGLSSDHLLEDPEFEELLKSFEPIDVDVKEDVKKQAAPSRRSSVVSTAVKAKQNLSDSLLAFGDKLGDSLVQAMSNVGGGTNVMVCEQMKSVSDQLKSMQESQNGSQTQVRIISTNGICVQIVAAIKDSSDKMADALKDSQDVSRQTTAVLAEVAKFLQGMQSAK